jgi:hypothetical protein
MPPDAVQAIQLTVPSTLLREGDARIWQLC